MRKDHLLEYLKKYQESKGEQVRVGVVGVANVGKRTLLNQLGIISGDLEVLPAVGTVLETGVTEEERVIRGTVNDTLGVKDL